MPISNYIGLFNRRRTLLLTLAFVSCVISLLNWHVNRSYVAKSVVLVQKADNGMLLGVSEVASRSMLLSQDQLDKYVRFLKSRPYFMALADDLLKNPKVTELTKELELKRSLISRLFKRSAPHEPDSLRNALARVMAARLRFNAGVANTIEISVDLPSAESALWVSQTTLETALRFINGLELQELNESKDYLTVKRDETESHLRTIDRNYLTLDRGSDILLSTGASNSPSLGGSLIDDYQSTSLKLSENERLVEAIKKQLNKFNKTAGQKTAVDPGLMGSIRLDLETLYAKRMTLKLEGFAPGSRQLSIIEDQIRVAEQQLKDLNPSFSVGDHKESGESPWTYMNLTAKLKELNQERLFLKAKLDAVQKILKPTSQSKSPTARLRQMDYLLKRADLQYAFYSELTKRLFDIDMRRILVQNQLVVIEPPSASGLVRQPGLIHSLFLAMLFAVTFGVMLAFQLEQMNPLLLDGKDMDGMNVRVLGYVPDLTPRWRERQRKVSNLPEHILPMNIQRPDSREALVFKHLRARLTHFIERSERKVSVITITSTARSEGKSFVSLNIAIALAKLGKRVLLIDADLRARRLTRSVAHDALEGLCNEREPDKKVTDAIIKDTAPNLDFLPAGDLPDDPSEFFASPRFPDILKQACAGHDLVIVDTPPTMEFPDSITVSGLTDATILVGRVGGTRLKSLATVIEQLSGTAPLIWSVLNYASGPHVKMLPYPSYPTFQPAASAKPKDAKAS